ncbi:MAG: S8 family serine peptidase, partial [Actinomycetota bacterium]
MKIAFGISWNDSKRGRLAAMAVVALAVSMLAAPLSFASTSSQGSGMVSVIVRELPGAGRGPEAVVAESGGEITRRMEIIDGFSAELPRSALARLEATEGVHSVTLDARVELLTLGGLDAAANDGSLYNVNRNIKTNLFYPYGYTGKGVDIALIDSGVAPVEGLNGSNKIINGPDLSVEQGDPNVRHLDTFGHGTHMAGIIAGRDSCTGTSVDYTNHDCFTGVAPESRIVNVKIANAQGATDVSQVIAGIDWVVQHRNDNGMNIRVLNLSFGTDGTQSYLLDPLTYAAEVAWHKG